MRLGNSLLKAVVVCSLFTAITEDATGKTPGNVHCYGGICHRVLTRDETAARAGVPTRMYASHYDSCERDRFNPCGLTSSGAPFDADRPDNAASVIYPDGTIILVFNPANRTAAVLRVNSLGPFKGNRVLDVSRGTAEKLGFARSGVARLHVTVLKAPTAQETKYRGHRVYAKVPGFLGQFRTIDEAIVVATRSIGTSLPPLRPIVKATPDPVPKHAAVLPELPLTSTLSRFAAGLISLAMPPSKPTSPKAAANRLAMEKSESEGSPPVAATARAGKSPPAAPAGKMTATMQKRFNERQLRMGLGLGTEAPGPAKCPGGVTRLGRCVTR